MIEVGIRELTHNFSKYLKQIKAGETIVILERNKPVAEVSPHRAHIEQPGWKQPVKKLKIDGLSLSDAVSRSRREERS